VRVGSVWRRDPTVIESERRRTCRRPGRQLSPACRGKQEIRSRQLIKIKDIHPAA
jgi:hypothetical protein